MGTARPSGRRVIALLVLFMVAAATAVVQTQRLPLRTYSSADGLAGNDVLALLADSHGFLWVGTKTGLTRFDGREFRTFGPRDGLPHPFVTALLEDRHGGAIWIGTKRGLARIEPAGGNMSAVPLGAQASEEVQELLQTQDGRIWVVAGAQLYVFPDVGRQGALHAVHVPVPLPPALPRSRIEAITEGTHGDLWIGTSGGLLRLLHDQRTLLVTVRPPAQHDRIFDLSVDRQGRLWITHWGLSHAPGVHFGIYVLLPHPPDQAASDAVSSLHSRARRSVGAGNLPMPRRAGDVTYVTAGGPIGDARVFGVFPTDDDGVWITTSDGLVRVESTGARRFDARHGLGVPVQVIAKDGRHNLWLGTPGLGIVRVEAGGPITYTARNGFPLGAVERVLEDRSGTLCLTGADVNGYRWFGALQHDQLLRFLPAGTERLGYWGWGWNQVFLQARDREWWVPTGEGLLRYPAAASCAALATNRPKAWYRRAHGLPSDDVFRLFEDSRGDLWIASGRTVRWVRTTGTFEIVPGPTDVPTAFAEDHSGAIWIGFYLGGLARWRAGQVQYFTAREGVPDGLIESLLVDSTGRLWIGTQHGGLARVEQPGSPVPKFVRPPINESLADTPVFAIVEDQQRQIYIATAGGVLRLNRDLQVTRRYSMMDGLPSHDVRSALTDSRGDVWLGTHRGLSRLAPQSEPPATPLAVFIDSLRVGGAPQALSPLGAQTVRGLTIQPDSRRVEISYGSPSLIAGEGLSYAIRLNGGEWSPPSTNRTALYPSLPPGPYHFEARALSNGRVSPIPASVTFRILPPIWQRWWIQTIVLLCVIGAAYAAYRARVTHLVALERVRSRIATDLHDDLGARLSRISILSEVAARRVSSDTSSAERLLGEVGETARSLLEAAADITWSVDPQQDNLASLAARVRHFAADMLDSRDIQWTLEAPRDDGVAIPLSPELRRHLLLVFQEAINNIVRHAQAHRVSLGLRVAGDRLTAEICDDGRGFCTAGVADGNGHPIPAGTFHAGRGLTNMSERARELRGQLTVTSAPGCGTEIRLSVPCR